MMPQIFLIAVFGANVFAGSDEFRLDRKVNGLDFPNGDYTIVDSFALDCSLKTDSRGVFEGEQVCRQKGSKIVVYQAQYKNGKLNGTMSTWRPASSNVAVPTSESHFKAGTLEGLVSTRWNPLAKRWAQTAEYSNGKKNGYLEFLTFDRAQGKLLQEEISRFSDDKKQGYSFTRSDGKVKSIACFSNDIQQFKDDLCRELPMGKYTAILKSALSEKQEAQASRCNGVKERTWSEFNRTEKKEVEYYEKSEMKDCHKNGKYELSINPGKIKLVEGMFLEDRRQGKASKVFFLKKVKYQVRLFIKMIFLKRFKIIFKMAS